MKKIILPLCILFFHFILIAQRAPSYNITISKEFKGEKGSSDFNIIARDQSNMYSTESWLSRKPAYNFGKDYGYSMSINKLDKDLNIINTKVFTPKSVNDYSIYGFRVLNENIYLLATDYDKKSSQYKFYIGKTDKGSGDLTGDLVEFAGITVDKMGDHRDFKINSLEDGSGFFSIHDNTTESKVSYGIHFLDKELGNKQSLIVNLSFRPYYYFLNDVKAINRDKIVFFGMEYKDEPTGKKSRRVFKNHIISIYDIKTKKLKNVTLQTGNKYLVEGKLLQRADGETFISGFYSNSAERLDVNGFFICKINTDAGSIEINSFKEIDGKKLGNGFLDETDTKKEKKTMLKALKGAVEENQFPGHFVIKSMTVNPADSSFIILSELSHYNSSSSIIDNSIPDRVARFSEVVGQCFLLKDILIIKSDKYGNINSITNLPKYQIEYITSGSQAVNGTFLFSYANLEYFSPYGDKPWFSSYRSMIHKNNLIIILNDHPENIDNTESGKPVRVVYDYTKSNLYGVSIDLTTGQMNRKKIYSNDEKNIILPRDAVIVGNNFVIPLPAPHLLGKTDFRIAKVTVD